MRKNKCFFLRIRRELSRIMCVAFDDFVNMYIPFVVIQILCCRMECDADVARPVVLYGMPTVECTNRDWVKAKRVD